MATHTPQPPGNPRSTRGWGRIKAELLFFALNFLKINLTTIYCNDHLFISIRYLSYFITISWICTLSVHPSLHHSTTPHSIALHSTRRQLSATPATKQLHGGVDGPISSKLLCSPGDNGSQGWCRGGVGRRRWQWDIGTWRDD